jgi:hypothetical protein
VRPALFSGGQSGNLWWSEQFEWEQDNFFDPRISVQKLCWSDFSLDKTWLFWYIGDSYRNMDLYRYKGLVSRQLGHIELIAYLDSSLLVRHQVRADGTIVEKDWAVDTANLKTGWQWKIVIISRVEISLPQTGYRENPVRSIIGMWRHPVLHWFWITIIVTPGSLLLASFENSAHHMLATPFAKLRNASWPGRLPSSASRIQH